MSRQVDVKALISHIVKGDGQDKCRICLGDTSEGQVYLGDTVMLDGDRPVTLAELLETITGVEVSAKSKNEGVKTKRYTFFVYICHFLCKTERRHSRLEITIWRRVSLVQFFRLLYFEAI